MKNVAKITNASVAIVKANRLQNIVVCVLKLQNKCVPETTRVCIIVATRVMTRLHMANCPPMLSATATAEEQ